MSEANAQEGPSTGGRRPRADAQRNRQRLIDVARQAYTSDGDIALETIAQRAGVGIGTLYRNFPTRESLVEVVYEAELAQLTTEVDWSAGDSAASGLRAWMDRYAVFSAHKRGMVETLRAGWSAGTIATPTTRGRVRAVIDGFLERGAADGSLRRDVGSDDITSMLLGVFLSAGPTADRVQLGRLLDLLLDSLRPRS